MEQFDKSYGDKFPLGYTYDSNGNILTFKNSNGFWSEWTYDSRGNELTYKDSNGYWEEWTYDSNGNKLTHKNSEGYSLKENKNAD